MDKVAQRCVLMLFAIVLLLMIILIPLSFSYVDYYEYGLLIRKSTGSINTERVYGRGRYNVGPDKKFIFYQADAHHEHFESLSVFSAGQGNESIGLAFEVDVDFTFLLIREEIGQLHKDLSFSYKDIINSRAKDAIKNKAINVTFIEYFQDRKNVELIFRGAVQSRWNEDPPLHCTLDQFHLGRIKIPETVAQKQLQTRVQNERNQMEEFLQKSQIERERTAVEVNALQLEKDKLLASTKADADLLRANARAEANRMVHEAKINGTALLFAAAGITSQEEMIAFTYIHTLKNRQNLDLDISYLSSENILRTSTAFSAV